ncbi:MAG: cysteine desulfurase NifS [Candidatus Margulisbacteria bacterium]|jgi:cysteine desulfurase|nr:cysteine desulfurase NifS [Candidatus Margulisiibacteriota bacterium]
MSNRTYLDFAATTPTDPSVLAAMLPYFSEKYGNPSSIHSFGQETRAAIEAARQQVAGLIAAKPEEIVFTSGGTEADNQALEGIAWANEKNGNHIICSAIEHHAVLHCAEFLKKRGFAVTVVPVDQDGLVSPEAVAQAITPKTVLVSVMHANNEIGTVEPIREISEVIGRRTKDEGRKIYFHTDAVQTAGHLPINVAELGVDLLSISAHKLYGPKGIGALYIKKGTRLTPFLHGGGQENNRRASTENVPGIVGFGAAADLAAQTMAEENAKLLPLRDKLIKGLTTLIPDVRLNGHASVRLPNNVNVSVKFIEGESMLLNLDMLGIAASSGSACTSGSLDPSHVLLAIGLPHEIAHGSLRFTLGKQTTEAEIDLVLEKLPPIVDKLRRMSPLYPGGKK